MSLRSPKNVLTKALKAHIMIVYLIRVKNGSRWAMIGVCDGEFIFYCRSRQGKSSASERSTGDHDHDKIEETRQRRGAAAVKLYDMVPRTLEPSFRAKIPRIWPL